MAHVPDIVCFPHDAPSSIIFTMKILFLTDFVFEDQPGGSRTAARELAHGLIARGHAVTFLVRTPAGQPASDTILHGVRVVRYAVPPGGPSAYVKAGRDACIRLLRSEHFDIAHTHFAFAAAGPLKALPPTVPRVRTFHGPWDLEGWIEDTQQSDGTKSGFAGTLKAQLKRRLRCRIERQNLAGSARVLTLSRCFQSLAAQDYGVTLAQSALIPGGADTQRFVPSSKTAARAALGLPANGPLLLSIRRLAPRMGLDTLIHAMPAVLRACPGTRLFIGGKGPEQERLCSLIQTLSLQDSVRLLGFIPDSQLAAYYQAADLFVLPTLALEGFGLVTTESLSCGTPVLGTPVGATPELLAPLDPRLIASSPDAPGLARSISAFLSEDWRYTLFPERLHTYVRDHYTWERHTAQVELIYQSLLSTPLLPPHAIHPHAIHPT